MTPRLSVLLPVRNAAPWLSSSLASLWRQEWRDFEVIAVNDGSTDGSGELLERAAAHEPRLRIAHTSAAGLPSALNTALALSTAPLIARHDADDVSHRHRFAQQVALLDAQADKAVCGTLIRLFPSQAFGTGMRRWAQWHNSLLTHEEMRCEMLIDSPLAHGTAMIRRSALDQVGGWNERGWAEDLDLWVRLAEHGARFAKVPQALYGWRQHASSSTRTDPRYTWERFTQLKVAALDRTVLAGGRRAALAGVGESLRRWEAALGARVACTMEIRVPPVDRIPDAAEPLVIALLSPQARRRWREALTARGWSETLHFIFVA